MLYVLCEGPSEELFVSTVLNPRYLVPLQKQATPIGSCGQLKPFSRVLRQLQNLLRNPQARVTTLIDYYGMPADYPGMPHRPLPPGNIHGVYAEIARLEGLFAQAVDSPRFIPHYSLHEFESLAFADPAAVEEQHRRTGGGSIIADVRQMVTQAQGNPELVNDSVATSPSHRLVGLWPAGQFQKTVDSVGIVQRIPFGVLRSQCRHFDAWVTQL